MRTTFYLDGQNIHHTLKGIGLESYNFDFRGFVEDLAKKWHPKRQITVKYYGAIFPRELNEYKHHRDSNFFDHLEQTQKITVRRGKFNYDHSGRNQYPPHEKGVDVLLAVDLIMDGFYRAYEEAIIFSNDTDLIPAIVEAKKITSGVRILNISMNPLHDFKNACDHSFVIFEHKLKKFDSPDGIKPSSDMLKQLQDRFKK